MGASAPPSPPAMANEAAPPASPEVEQELEEQRGPESDLELEFEKADHHSHNHNHNFNSILRELGRANLSIGNRLRSIRADAAFVEEVAAAYRGGKGQGQGRPLVANERCGSWYVAPGRKAASAYFKSTDGHFGQWRFSARRLNLHLLPLIGARDGCVLVDSTRRGKRMPDALSKTVPIWCCVLNSALFPELAAGGGGGGETTERSRRSCHEVHVPPNVVSDSERAQMQARIPEHVAALRALGLDLPALRQSLRKPLRPVWVTQESQLVPAMMLGEGDGDAEDDGDDEVFADYHPVVCCTSSRRVVGAEMSEGGYIQGAGDDTENWALGLTPPVFWEHADLLLSTPEPDLPDLVRSLVAKHASSSPASAPKEIAPCLFVGALPIAAESDQSRSTCTVVIHAKTIDSGSWERSPLLMEVGIGKHKIASRNLRVALPNICDFVQRYIESAEGEGKSPGINETGMKRILIACESGKDISVGIALALLCQFQDSKGDLSPRQERYDINKSVIKVKLGSIMTKFPDANPSRATLQSVNSYLMG